MKKISLLVLIFLAVAGFAVPSFADGEPKPLILDVRTQEEWNRGHLEGAVLIPYDRIGEEIGRIVKDKSRKIYVYCRTGRRSQIAMNTLNALGYKNVVNLGSLEDAARILNRKIVQ